MGKGEERPSHDLCNKAHFSKLSLTNYLMACPSFREYTFQRHRGGGIKPTNSRSTASAKANAVKSRPCPAIA